MRELAHAGYQVEEKASKDRNVVSTFIKFPGLPPFCPIVIGPCVVALGCGLDDDIMWGPCSARPGLIWLPGSVFFIQ